MMAARKTYRPWTLDDAGLSNGMADELVEAVCDAMATARMRELFG